MERPSGAELRSSPKANRNAGITIPHRFYQTDVPLPPSINWKCLWFMVILTFCSPFRRMRNSVRFANSITAFHFLFQLLYFVVLSNFFPKIFYFLLLGCKFVCIIYTKYKTIHSFLLPFIGVKICTTLKIVFPSSAF